MLRVVTVFALILIANRVQAQDDYEFEDFYLDNASLSYDSLNFGQNNLNFNPDLEHKTPKLGENHLILEKISKVKVQSSYEQLSYKRKYLKKSLNERVIKVTTVEEFPFTYTVQGEDGKIQGYGAAFKVLDILADKHNFTYELIRPAFNYFYNSSVQNETALELLTSAKADILVGFIPPMKGLTKLTRYSFPLQFGRYYVMASRPANADIKRGLLAPFDWTTWICTLISILLIAPLMYCIENTRRKWETDSTVTTTSEKLTYGKLSWFVYGALLRQGSNLKFKSNSIRIIVASWWIFVTVLTSFYTADLIAYLSSFTVQRNVQDLEQILASGNQLVAYEGSSVLYAIVEEDTRIVPFKKTVQLLPPVKIGNGYDEVKDLEHKVVKKDIAIIRDYFSAQHFMYDYYLSVMTNISNHADPCPFVLSQKPLVWLPQSFVFRRGSQLKTLLDPDIKLLFESGITKKLQSEGLPTDSEICAVPKAGADKTTSWSEDNYLRIKDLYRIFIVTFIGLSLALIAFLVEKYITGNGMKENINQGPKITVNIFTLED